MPDVHIYLAVCSDCVIRDSCICSPSASGGVNRVMVFAFGTFNSSWCRGSLSFILKLDAKVVDGGIWLAFLVVWLR